MPLASGTRLGAYEIIAPLGAGGMGEVFRARDTRLGRDVAIKVLPQHLSTNPEVRARFDREAKTISSLNHPHICTLYDVGREGDTDYLVMELVEGETLAARLVKGSMAPADVLRLGSQIADALDRAHRAGVIHRDLKPGNVMLTRSGAKLMDFGLARATGLGPGGDGSGLSHAALTQSPTIAAPLTAEGTIVGTFQYMSPEQLEGKEADERSDIWALGCVLYEMATGRRAFEGRSQASLISAIMSSEPPPVSQIQPLAPPGLDRLVRTCLHKDPEERVRTAHDVKLQLVGIQEGASSSGAVAPVTKRAAPRASLAWAIAALASLVAIAMAAVLVPRALAPKPMMQLESRAPAGQQFDPYPSLITISPDGQTLAFAVPDSSARYWIWVRRLDSSEPVRLVQGGFGGYCWSPDSKTIVVANGRLGKLLTVPVTGGTPTVLCDIGIGRGVTWSRHGVILFAPNPQGPLFQISASGGQPVQATWIDTTRHEVGHRFPCFLPDGRHFLFASLPRGPQGIDICVGSLGSRSVRKIMTAECTPVYAEPGYLIFRRSGKVMAQRFDVGRLQLQGDPRPLVDVPPEVDLEAEPVASASRDGKLVVLDSPLPNTQLGWLDRAGTPRSTLALPAGAWGRPVLSPDDRYAVVPNGDDLWRVDLARASAVRLTSSSGVNSEPIWSPDGSQVGFTTNRQGREEIFVMNSDGSGEQRLVSTTSDNFKSAESWSPAGILFTNISGATFRDIWIAPVPEGRAVPLLHGPFSEFNPNVSPNGRWIAYLSNEAGPDDIYIQSFPTLGHKTRVTNGGVQRLWWMPGSDELCYRAQSEEMMSVKLTPRGAELEVGEPRVLFRYPPNVVGSSLTHDGQRLLVAYTQELQPDRAARVIVNWTALLKR